jgi:hypothetical protein
MGIFYTFRHYCLEDEAPVKTEPHTLTKDYLYFQNEENWYRLQQVQHFDHNKFIFLYPKYGRGQKALVERWKVVNFKMSLNEGPSEVVISERWKYAIRKYGFCGR